MLRRWASILLVSACTGRSAAVLADRGRVDNPALTGTWDLTLTLEKPYPLGFAHPTARRVCGTIGFVDAVETANGDVNRKSDGVYRVALAQLGLDWLDDAKFPSAVARQREFGDRTPASSDSVRITLNPDSQEHIELLGVYRGSQITGNWTAQSARGTASGVFTLLPHASGSGAANC